MKRERQNLVAADMLQERRFQRDVEFLHSLGARATFEILAEVGRARMCRTYIEELTARFARLDPKTVRAVDGDRFSPPPIYEVA